MALRPFAAVQSLVAFSSGKYTGLLGCAFRLSAPNRFLTAGHVVRGFPVDELRVLQHGDHLDLRVSDVLPHPIADLAVLTVEGTVRPEYQRFNNVEAARLGAPVYCFGSVGSGTDPITHRVVAGIVQRRFVHDKDAWTSPALELAMPIPKGMSGGPVFLQSQQSTVVGLAIGTIESEVVVHAVEEYEDENKHFRERVSNIVRYGVAVDLPKITDWLDPLIKSE